MILMEGKSQPREGGDGGERGGFTSSGLVLFSLIMALGPVDPLDKVPRLRGALLIHLPLLRFRCLLGRHDIARLPAWTVTQGRLTVDAPSQGNKLWRRHLATTFRLGGGLATA